MRVSLRPREEKLGHFPRAGRRAAARPALGASVALGAVPRCLGMGLAVWCKLSTPWLVMVWGSVGMCFILMLAPALPLLTVLIGLFTEIVLVVDKITGSLRNDTLWELWI